MRRWSLPVLFAGCTLAGVCVSSTIAAVTPGLPAPHVATAAPRWSQGYTLVILDPGADPRAALDRVHAAGGSIAIVVPPRILMGWIAP